ncbi:acyltransferase family protein [Rudanella paleaurantiibacter]|uniref:Acyltransferase family protein n=1 Tax=Rudanella paleaurantiibacter TaxID=2614655 RepID=A0A7J5TY04_9BACT|nr:acyltransferase [Rudanella paleaurantiibacter]KAB7730012.1 acyltransferase family protein [Rudanella paleaurantiibacter]
MKPHPKTTSTRFYELDLLRLLAAMSVLVFHYAFRGYAADNLSPVQYPALEPVAKYGYLGVELFFIISGFVVLMSAEHKTVRQFVVSRVVRLYPAFWVACTLTFVVLKLFGPQPGGLNPSPYLEVYGRQYLFNLTMLQYFFGQRDIDGVYWTLTYEMLFYGLVVLLIALRGMPRLTLLIGCWLAYGVLSEITAPDAPLNTVLFPKYSPLFCAGMIFYRLAQRRLAQHRLLERTDPVWQLYGLLVCSWVMALRNALAYADEQQAYFHTYFSPVVVGVAITGFYLTFWAIIRRKLYLGQSPGLAVAGALTYPLYLLHHNIGYVLFRRLGHLVEPYSLLIGITLAMLLMAYALHRLVEKPMSRWLRARLEGPTDEPPRLKTDEETVVNAVRSVS